MLRKTIFLILVTLASMNFYNNEVQANSERLFTLDITIQGIHDNSMKSELLNNISISHLKNTLLYHPNQVYFLSNKCAEEIKDLLKVYGYYMAEVTTRFNIYENLITVIFEIVLGNPVQIETIEINIEGEGKNSKISDVILEKIPIKPESILTQNLYEESKKLLIEGFFDNGYLDNTLTHHEIYINMKTCMAKVKLTLETGSRYKIGDIRIKQQNYKYSKDFIYKIININEENFISQETIINANKRLQNTGYFRTTRVYPQIHERDKLNKTVPIILDLISDHSRNYTFGVGYGKSTGPRITLETLFRHLTNNGQQFLLNVAASRANIIFSADYIFPAKNPLQNYWNIIAKQNHVSTYNYNERQTNFSILYTHKHVNWQSTISLQQCFINYTTSLVHNINYKYCTASLGLIYDNTQQNGFWKQGIVWNQLSQISIKSPLSDQYFIRNNIDLHWSRSLLPEWNRFIFNGKFGFITVNNIQSVAPSLRFYSGGIGNLLGYPPLSHGPKINGNIIGGRYLITGLAGIEQRIYKKFSSTIFYNLGNASNKANFSDVEILSAIGIGINYKTPIGPITAFFIRTLAPKYWSFDLHIGMGL